MLLLLYPSTEEETKMGNEDVKYLRADSRASKWHSQSQAQMTWLQSRLGYVASHEEERVMTGFQPGKSQLADTGHKSIPETNAVKDACPPPPGMSPIMRDNTVDTRQSWGGMIYLHHTFLTEHWTKADPKEHILCDSIYLKSRNKPNNFVLLKPVLGLPFWGWWVTRLSSGGAWRVERGW